MCQELSCCGIPNTHNRVSVVDGTVLMRLWPTQEDFMRSAERQMDKERQVAEREGEVGQGARPGEDDDDDDTASVVGGLTPRGSSP